MDRDWKNALIAHLFEDVRLADDDCFDLLDRLGTGDVPHSGRSLKSHLLGTHALLRSWGNPRDVCFAGLFHSVYGTQFFKPGIAVHLERPALRSVIGRRSEELVYLFSVANRETLRGSPRGPYTVEFPGSPGGSIPVSREVLARLIEIEVANTLELVRAPSISSQVLDLLVSMRGRFDDCRAFMSQGAKHAYPMVLDFYEHLRRRRSLQEPA